MCQKTEIAQTSGFGSHDNTFIGEQHNHGLSVSDVTQMAFAIFREYYPQLREEALTEMRRLVEERLEKVPQDCIIPPKARIAVSTLQYASITDEQAVRELFAGLLANSMNSENCNRVHPSYVEIIKQLSEDDAKILHYMRHQFCIPVLTIKLLNGHGKHLDNYSDVPEKIGCSNCHSLEGCFNNLIRLGLLDKYSAGVCFLPETIALVKNNPFYQAKYQEALERQKPHTSSSMVEQVAAIACTDFGRDFCNVCIFE